MSRLRASEDDRPMRILVTGGTGFVGSHATKALLDAGHEVRLLVRSPKRIRRSLGPLGIEDKIDHITGDVTDRASVADALAGCEAVVHAASIYSLDVRAAEEMARVNAPSTQLVIEEATQRGLETIVHVSTTVVFVPGRGEVVSPGDPVGSPRGPYARSKAEAERIAREAQDEGAPVAIVYPGGVYGPHDPYLSEQTRLSRDLLRRRLPMLPREGYHVVDVRDTAATIRAVLEAGGGGGRYIVPGHHASVPEMASLFAELTGRRIPHIKVPARSMRPTETVLNALQRRLPGRLPISAEAMEILAADLRFDTSRTTEDLGISARPLRTVLADQAVWLAEAGHVKPRQIGALARARA